MQKELKTISCHLNFLSLSKCDNLLVCNIIVTLKNDPLSIVALAIDELLQKCYVNIIMKSRKIIFFIIQYKITKQYTAF